MVEFADIFADQLTTDVYVLGSVAAIVLYASGVIFASRIARLTVRPITRSDDAKASRHSL